MGVVTSPVVREGITGGVQPSGLAVPSARLRVEADGDLAVLLVALTAPHALDDGRELSIPAEDARQRHGLYLAPVLARTTLNVDRVLTEMVIEFLDGRGWKHGRPNLFTMRQASRGERELTQGRDTLSTFSSSIDWLIELYDGDRASAQRVAAENRQSHRGSLLTCCAHLTTQRFRRRRFARALRRSLPGRTTQSPAVCP